VLPVVSAESAVPDAFTRPRYRALLRFAEQAYADTVRHSKGEDAHPRKGSVPLITDARSAASVEMHSRVMRYTLTMAFRTACFISMVFVPGPMRWVLFACALVLPYIAVIMANQANQRSIRKRINSDMIPDRPQLTAGPAESPALPDHSAADDREHRDQPVA
jgi:hypothetical protein